MRSVYTGIVSIIILFSGLFLAKCSVNKNKVQLQQAINTDTSTTAVPDSFFTSTFDTKQLKYNFSFPVVLSTGDLNTVPLKEASGIVASRKYPGLYWTHNDSGNPNDVYLIDEKGQEKARINLSGIRNRDWEDITYYNDTDNGNGYIIISETGDNHLRYGNYFLYAFQEPSLAFTNEQPVVTSVVPKKFSFHYPDTLHNAETLMADPITGSVFIVTKSTHHEAVIYQTSIHDAVNGQLTLKKVGVLPIKKLTAGDISPDGSMIIIKDLDFIYYWDRPVDRSVEKTMQQLPQLIPYSPEPQGEAIAWTLDDKGFVTVSESEHDELQTIYKHTRPVNKTTNTVKHNDYTE